MRKDYEKLFAKIDQPELSPELLNKVMDRISKEKAILTARRRIFIFSLCLAVSIAGFVPALQAVGAGFANSGFAQFFSLLFSDFNAVLGLWKSFALTLLEALPVASLALTFVLILAFLSSLKFLAKDAKVIFASKRLTT